MQEKKLVERPYKGERNRSRRRTTKRDSGYRGINFWWQYKSTRSQREGITGAIVITLLVSIIVPVVYHAIQDYDVVEGRVERYIENTWWDTYLREECYTTYIDENTTIETCYYYTEWQFHYEYTFQVDGRNYTVSRSRDVDGYWPRDPPEQEFHHYSTNDSKNDFCARIGGYDHEEYGFDGFSVWKVDEIECDGMENAS
jgi:hypothetical protein